METRDDIMALLNAMGENCVDVEITSTTPVNGASFVIAKMKFNVSEGPDEYTIPFVVYPDGGVFMPNDWQGWLPDKAEDIDEIEWVSMPDKGRAVMLNGLPRTFARF